MTLPRRLRQTGHVAAKVIRRTIREGRERGLMSAARSLAATAQEVIRSRFRVREEESAFDSEFHVDTAGVTRIRSMEIASPNYIYGVYYKPTIPDEFHAVMGQLSLDHERFTFVDFGSGKGLVLLLASDYPFRKIIGVEFAADLHRTAESNIRRYRNPNQKCRDIKSVWCDATEFRVPESPLILYFYEPFEAPVLAKVLQNVRGSFKRTPREIVLIYRGLDTGPVVQHDGNARGYLLENEPNLKYLGVIQRCYKIYQTRVSDTKCSLLPNRL